MHSDLRNLLSILLLSFLTLPCLAQKGTVKGIVLDSATKEQIPFVEVSLMGTDFTTNTDLNGAFKMSQVPVGRYTLRVTFVGYYVFYKEMMVEENKVADLQILMQTDAVRSNDREIISNPVVKIEGDTGVKDQYDAFVFYWSKCARTDSVDVKFVVEDTTGHYLRNAIIHIPDTGGDKITDDKGIVSYVLPKSESPVVLNLNYVVPDIKHTTISTKSYYTYSSKIRFVPGDCQTIRITLKDPQIDSTPLISPESMERTVTRESYANGKSDSAECLSPLKMRYEIVDSVWINKSIPLRNVNLPNVICCYAEDGIDIAYYTTDKNKWSVFYLPFRQRTNDFQLVNLDGIGESELIVKGQSQEYGSGGGTGYQWIMIFNLDSVPTRIFMAYYGCWDESFGDRTDGATSSYVNAYERDIKFTSNSMIVSPIDKSKYPFTGCALTEIPSGTYTMVNGRLQLLK